MHPFLILSNESFWIHRPDMINIMMQVREGSLKHQTEDKSKEVPDGFATVNESEIG